MKKTFLLAVLTCLVFAGCSKDGEDQKKITNLSGEAWYDTYIYFSAEESVESELTGFEQKGTVEIGESCSVSTSQNYFSVTFTDSSGDMQMSKKILFNGNSATVRADDLY